MVRIWIICAATEVGLKLHKPFLAYRESCHHHFLLFILGRNPLCFFFLLVENFKKLCFQKRYLQNTEWNLSILMYLSHVHIFVGAQCLSLSYIDPKARISVKWPKIIDLGVILFLFYFNYYLFIYLVFIHLTHLGQNIIVLAPPQPRLKYDIFFYWPSFKLVFFFLFWFFVFLFFWFFKSLFFFLGGLDHLESD